MSLNRKYILILVFSGALLFLPFLGSVQLFDWDEINFAESAREMLVTGNYSQVQINYEPFWEKPPLFFWLQALSMKVFGVNEFAARLPNAVLGIITLLTFYVFGKRLFDERFGFTWALCYMGSFLPFLYFKSGIIDPLFNYFIFLSVFFMASSVSDKNGKATRYIFYSGIFIGLAVLTKGPVGFLILLLSFLAYLVITKFKKSLSLKNAAVFIFSALAVSFLWFGFETIKNGPWFIQEFITYQIRLFSTPDAGHSQPFYYHFIVVGIGCFPISILAAGELFKKHNNEPLDFNLWMKILFWVVMILFSIVTTKIAHYSSLSYFPLSYLAAYYICRLTRDKLRISRVMFILLAVFGFIFSALLTALPLLLMYKERIYGYIKDPFAVASLMAPVEWAGFEFLIGVIYLILIIYSLILIQKEMISRGFYTLFYSTAVSVFIFLVIVAPKIEGYSQKPAVEFFKKHSGEDVYMTPFGYKSYAQYFYFQQPPQPNKNSKENSWLLTGEIDKPVYFVVKSTAKKEMETKYPYIKFIEQSGGYALYYREKK
jgi:4-amino-4-deoxy-L-arabinose transferase-like glycosyltransferase